MVQVGLANSVLKCPKRLLSRFLTPISCTDSPRLFKPRVPIQKVQPNDSRGASSHHKPLTLFSINDILESMDLDESNQGLEDYRNEESCIYENFYILIQSSGPLMKDGSEHSPQEASSGTCRFTYHLLTQTRPNITQAVEKCGQLA